MAFTTVFAYYTNTDLTEGRGEDRPIGYCFLQETAERLGKRQYVQGTDCPVRAVTVEERDGGYFLPAPKVHIITPSDADMKKAEARRTIAAIVDKALKLGLSADEINALKKGTP